VTNPLIFMTVLGILGNLGFHHVMPSVIHGFLGTLGSAFSASALFLLGESDMGAAAFQCGSQCWGSVTFWSGSNSLPDLTPFFNDVKDPENYFFHIFFL
jgi:hypothetical protein